MGARTDPRRAALLRFLPHLLLALAGACALSAGIGLVWALVGGGPAPLGVILAPPILAVIVLVVVGMRRVRGAGP